MVLEDKLLYFFVNIVLIDYFGGKVLPQIMLMSMNILQIILLLDAGLNERGVLYLLLYGCMVIYSGFHAADSKNNDE